MDTALLVVDSLQGIVVPVNPPVVEQPLLPTIEEMCKLLKEWEANFIGAHSTATAKAVRADWQVFMGWCMRADCHPLPVKMEDLYQFLTDMVLMGRKRATINRYIYTVRRIHKAAGLPDPIKHHQWELKWKALIKRLAKVKRNAGKQAAPLKFATINRIINSLGNSDRDLRDAALMSLASDTLCRESELATVQLADLTATEDGTAWVMFMANSKTDQEGIGAYRFVSNEAKERIDAWCRAKGITEGYIFRATAGRPKRNIKGKPPPPHLLPAEIARIFRRRAKMAGVAGFENISGHSTRVGSAIDLIDGGASVTEAQYAGGWKSERMVHLYAKKSLAGSNAMAKMRGRQKRSA